jgi:hypothetical protein
LERLAVNNESSHSFHVKRFSLKEINKVEGKEKYRFEVSSSLQLWNIWTMRWKLIELGKWLDRKSNFN